MYSFYFITSLFSALSAILLFCMGRIWILHGPLPPLSKASVGGRINEWLIDVMAADRQ